MDQLFSLWCESNSNIFNWAALNALRLMEDSETNNEAGFVILVSANIDSTPKDPLHTRFLITEAFPATLEHLVSLSKESGHLFVASPPNIVRVIIVSDSKHVMSLGVPLKQDIEKDKFIPTWKETLKRIVGEGRGKKGCQEGVGMASSIGIVEIGKE